MKPVYTETENGITYNLYVQQDDLPVRGNLIVSGDAQYDRKCEDEVISRLDDGDDWAWAMVTVEARAGGCSGRDYLGGCSYTDDVNFRKGGYWEDMKERAKDELIQILTEAANALRRLQAA